MKHVSNALILALGLALAACGKTPEAPAETVSTAPVPTLENALPVEQADPALQAVASSVVRIELPEGSSGSGFFISPRIILTNHHVVARERCSLNACPGVTAVRGFYRSGENQVFYRLKPLAFNATLDFMFLEVLDEAAPVEGLPLASAEEVAKLTEADSLSALGHPLAAPLKAAPAKLLSEDGADLIIDSAIFHGNSGGPLVHLPSGKVVGLVTQVTHDLMKYEVGSKSIPFQAAATKISTIVAAMQRDHSGTRGANRWDPHQFKVESGIAGFLTSLFVGPLKSPESFFATRQLDPNQVTARASLVVSNLQRDPDSKDSLENFLLQMVRYDLRRGQSTPLSTSLLARIEKNAAPGSGLKRFMNFYDPSRRQACASEAEEKPAGSNYQTLGQVCHLTHFQSGTEVLSSLEYVLRHSVIEEESTGFAILNVIEDQLRLRTTLDGNTSETVAALLARIDPIVKRGMMRTRLDSFKLTWETHPDLLLNGGFAASF